MSDKWFTVDGFEVPETWKDRCSGDGHLRYTDSDGVRRFADTDEPVGIALRPCARCGKYPNPDGDDFCIQSLGKVINACCGHGSSKGYIQFEGGITIRGYFDIEYDDPEIARQRLGTWGGKN